MVSPVQGKKKRSLIRFGGVEGEAGRRLQRRVVISRRAFVRDVDIATPSAPILAFAVGMRAARRSGVRWIVVAFKNRQEGSRADRQGQMSLPGALLVAMALSDGRLTGANRGVLAGHWKPGAEAATRRPPCESALVAMARGRGSTTTERDGVPARKMAARHLGRGASTIRRPRSPSRSAIGQWPRRAS